MIRKISLVINGARITVYREGGYDVEVIQEGIGWIVDTDNLVDEKLLQEVLSEGIQMLARIATKN